MKRLTRTLSVALVVGLAAACAAPRGPHVEAALAEAEARDVPVLLDFYTDWCSACRSFEAARESRPDLGRAIEEGAVLLKVNAEEGEGIALAERFGVDSYPTFIVVDGDLEPVQRWSGYGWAEDFLDSFRVATAESLPIEARRARYESDPGPEDALALGRYHMALDEYAEALRYLREVEGHPYDLFLALYNGREEGLAEVDEIVAAAADALETAGKDDGRRVFLGLQMTNLAGEGHAIDVTPFVAAAYEASDSADESFLATARGELEIAHALHVERDELRALELKTATLVEGWEGRADDLNEVAWWCLENGVALDRAEEMARRGVDLAEAGTEKAMVLDTLAEICQVRGKGDEAVALIRRAIEEEPDSEYYREQLVRFQIENAPVL